MFTRHFWRIVIILLLTAIIILHISETTRKIRNLTNSLDATFCIFFLTDCHLGSIFNIHRDYHFDDTWGITWQKSFCFTVHQA